MHFNHPERTANKCKHSIHPSSPAYILWCPQCNTAAAQADLQRTRKQWEAEGGVNSPTYMRDRAWNTARLRHITTERRVKKTMRKDWVRQERERGWDEAHQQHLARYELFPPSSPLAPNCDLCTSTIKPCPPVKERTVAKATAKVAWWDRPGARVVDQILVPNTPPHHTKNQNRFPQARPKRSSQLHDLIQSYRRMKAVSDMNKQAWEDRCKTERAVRRKYDLLDDFEIEAEFFTVPISASHARHHHIQIQNNHHASERRANRHKRRAEGYKSSRSSLALSELAEDVTMDEKEAERLKLAEKDAEIQRLANVIATEVGYLYFVGDVDDFDGWRYDVERSNMALIYRKVQSDVAMGRLDEDGAETEEESEDM